MAAASARSRLNGAWRLRHHNRREDAEAEPPANNIKGLKNKCLRKVTDDCDDCDDCADGDDDDMVTDNDDNDDMVMMGYSLMHSPGG